jgi:hypothetical protein
MKKRGASNRFDWNMKRSGVGGKSQPDPTTELLEALKGLANNGCFCEMAVGNPMVHRHSPSCEKARAAIAKAEGR